MIPTEIMPPAITPVIARLSHKLDAAHPEYVTVQAAPTAIVHQCYLNVDACVQVHGGEPVEGWLIWEEERHRWLLAVHHCVWRSPAGQLIDVTPHVDKESRIVFAAGRHKWDRVHPVAGVYEPLVTDKKVRRLCEAGSDILRWLQRNTLSGLPFEPDMRYMQLVQEQRKLLSKLQD